MRDIQSPYIISQYGTYLKNEHLWVRRSMSRARAAHATAQQIILEYCPGGSLADYLRITRKTFTEPQIAAICRDVLAGLSYLHTHRKIHRDVKAGNILLGPDGRAKLADFGVAGQLSDNTMKRRTLTGTPYWMAPEVVVESGYDGKADVWSLGITCIELADGKPPFHSYRPMLAMMMIPNKPPPRLPDEEKYSQEFIAFLDAMLVKDPDYRKTAEEMLDSKFIQGAPASGLRQVLDEMVDRIEAGALEHDGDVRRLEMGRKFGQYGSVSVIEHVFIWTHAYLCVK